MMSPQFLQGFFARPITAHAVLSWTLMGMGILGMMNGLRIHRHFPSAHVPSRVDSSILVLGMGSSRKPRKNGKGL